MFAYFRFAVLATLLVSVFTPLMAKQNLSKSQNDAKEIMDRKFQIAYSKELERQFPAALIKITANCKASTTCANGVTLSCQAQGEHTSCYSDRYGTSCFRLTQRGNIVGSLAPC
ncbi:hypothetical protein NBRC116583_11170 [Arenicella sp. 4NH20-0111]|uniref:hypothetical protein n=1 Tax=Arenicella sp. 4NH20-0111 TaxID=3127648 RepID=UPI0031081199